MDLDKLRKRVEEARAHPQPRDAATQHLVDAQEAARRGGFVDGGVVVTPDGVIRRADQVRQSDGPVSRVTSQIFAADRRQLTHLIDREFHLWVEQPIGSSHHGHGDDSSGHVSQIPSLHCR